MLREEPKPVLATDGNCAFCGKSRREVRALLGSSFATALICDECLALCCGIFAQKSGVAHESRGDESALDFPDAKLATILAALGNQGPPALDAAADEFRCSFCDRPRRQVNALVNGPHVFICDGCVGSGVALIKRTGPATRA